MRSVGVPKEIKNQEKRVALTPAHVRQLTDAGHHVAVEAGAGIGSGFTDGEYAAAGARMTDAQSAWSCDIVVKVKEPQPSEYGYFRPDLILFTYLHLAAEPELSEAIRVSGLQAIAYEMVQLEDGSLPLLAPMSEVAGRIGVLMAARYLLSPAGGPGILPGGVPGVDRSRFVILGAGTAGQAAAQYAIGLGADVTVLDIRAAALQRLTDRYPGQVRTVLSTPEQVDAAVLSADAVISTVLIPGARAPRMVRAVVVRQMRPGSVIVDIAIDQGGSVETIDHATTHDQPVFTQYGVIHYAVANMPGAAPCTATRALTHATWPYVRQLADEGVSAILSNPALAKGLVCF